MFPSLTIQKLKITNSAFVKIFLLLPLTVSSINTFSKGADSLAFVENVKQFIYRQAEMDSIDTFYTIWSDTDKPFCYLYYSRTDIVKLPDSLDSFFIYFGVDEKGAMEKA